MITLRQLRYLDAVARTLHFGKAAAECAVSQPALSMQIQDLEASLGARLIERARGKVRLTETGEDVARRARSILTEVRDLADQARHGARTLTGPLRLGVIPSIAPYVLPAVLPALQARYPDLVLDLRESQTRHLTAELAAGGLDVLLLSLPLDEPGVETLHLFNDAFLLAMPAAGPMVRLPTRVPLSILKTEPLLLLEEGHCLRDQALTYCHAAQADVRSRLGATSLATIMQLVANGFGVTRVPEMAVAAEVRDPRVAVLRFQTPEPSRSVGLAWRKTSPRKPDFMALAAVIAAAAPAILGREKPPSPPAAALPTPRSLQPPSL